MAASGHLKSVYQHGILYTHRSSPAVKAHAAGGRKVAFTALTIIGGALHSRRMGYQNTVGTSLI